MSLSPVSNQPATDHPFLGGNFAPVRAEATADELRVTGTIPPELDGRLLRIGPNPVTDPDPADYHWFTGTGMAHGLRFMDGEARWFHSRYVRSGRVTEAMEWPDVEGPTHGTTDGTANTNIIQHAGKTLAIVEAGSLPVLLDDQLDTVCRYDFDGTLDGSFTAHPKVDPVTGELHAVTYYWEWDHVRYVVVGADGRVRRNVAVRVPGKPMIHDCAITESSVLIFDLPVHFDIDSAMTGALLPYLWNPSMPARVGVLGRDADVESIVWCDVEPCYVFHPLNAYDADDGTIVVDVVRHSSMFDTYTLGPKEGATSLDRWTIDPATGTVHETQLTDHSMEFPRHDERLIGRRHRYGYAIEVDENFDFGSALKHDVDSGVTERRDFGPGRQSLEPVFVPTAPDAAEDDGWLLAYVYDATTDTNDVVIWHAQDFTGGAVATIHLPVRVPFGFHGNWAPTPR